MFPMKDVSNVVCRVENAFVAGAVESLQQCLCHNMRADIEAMEDCYFQLHG